MKKPNKTKTYQIAMIGMLSAIAFIIEALNFSVPFMPSFIKLDFSELPALIGSFAMGPLQGILICLIKNIFNLLHTSTGGVGELANFIMGSSYVFTAGAIYKAQKTKRMKVYLSACGYVYGKQTKKPEDTINEMASSPVPFPEELDGDRMPLPE